MENNYSIRLETPADYYVTENVVRNAFWNVYRPGCLEHYVLHCFRDSKAFVPELDFVIESHGKIFGHVMFAHSVIVADNGEEIPTLTLGPICISPDCSRQGYGKALIDYALDRATEIGYGAVCLEGNIDFYGKSGFVVASTKNIHYNDEPFDDEVPYFLLKELKKDYLHGVIGVYHTPKEYFVDEAAAERFDTTFPPKEKLVLPTQMF